MPEMRRTAIAHALSRQSRQPCPNGRSRLAAALFAIFLGSLGIHKFYLGRVGWGVIYLLLCWTVIPGIVGFIEGILLLIMSEEDFNAKYGND